MLPKHHETSHASYDLKLNLIPWFMDRLVRLFWSSALDGCPGQNPINPKLAALQMLAWNGSTQTLVFQGAGMDLMPEDRGGDHWSMFSVGLGLCLWMSGRQGLP